MILFIDMVCPKPYSNMTLEKEPLGGTEATVVRVAEALGKTIEDVVVVQHCRKSPRASNNVIYMPLNFLEINKVAPTHIIAIRSAASLPVVHEKWPNTKKFLWMHDIPTSKLLLDIPVLEECRATILVVSEYHKTNVCSMILSNIEEKARKNVLVKRVYNPIDDTLLPDGTKYDKHKLLFLSSPVKGLDNTLACFNRLHVDNNRYKLFVANPGYFEDAVVKQDGVTVLGALPHPEVMRHVREAMCVFYPNTVFPETFGLVMAEANAVGTPVIAHDFGAANEVTTKGMGQVFDCRDELEVCRRVNMWLTDGRPEVSLDDKFRMRNVVEDWKGILK